MATPNPSQASSQLGKFRDEVLSAPKAAVKSLAQEPKKILESILGKADTGADQAEDSGIEDLVAGGATDPVAMQAQQKAHQQKVIQSQQDAQKKLQLHRQRLQEEKQFFDQRKQEQEVQVEQEEKQEEEEKLQIMQMKREKGAEQLDRQVSGRQGSKEQGRGKKF